MRKQHEQRDGKSEGRGATGWLGANELALIYAISRAAGGQITLQGAHDAVMAFNRKEGWVMARDCLRRLVARGLAARDGDRWGLTVAGERIAGDCGRVERAMLIIKRRKPAAATMQTVRRMVDGVLRTVKVYRRGVEGQSDSSPLNRGQKERLAFLDREKKRGRAQTARPR